MENHTGNICESFQNALNKSENNKQAFRNLTEIEKHNYAKRALHTNSKYEMQCIIEEINAKYNEY